MKKHNALMRMARFSFFIFLSFTFQIAFPQDTSLARLQLKTLCSEKFAGRGYVKNGDKTASKYIAGNFKNFGLISPEFVSGKNHLDTFNFYINAFPKPIKLSVDGNELNPGIDFIIDASSPSASGNFNIKWIDTSKLKADDKTWYNYIINTDFSGFALIADTFADNNETIKKRINELDFVPYQKPPAALIQLTRKQSIWTARQEQLDIPAFNIVADKFPVSSKKIKIKAKADFKKYTSQNVLGMSKGTKYPDSMVMVTAHYDHLGMMGNVIYPGANDNASGTVMLLQLAEYFAKNPAEYSILFVAFSGEEAGLIGSKNLCDKMKAGGNYPALSSVKFLLNLDLIGAGEDGVTAVNGEIHPEILEKFRSINSKGNYLKEITSRGKAANSDHYYFSEAGVNAFFCYLKGNYAYYHVPQDKAVELPFTRFTEAFGLFRDFIASF